MTYNFDPERWYANEQDALERAHCAGRLDRRAYEAALDRLQQRLDDLWDRLDGSYRLPGGVDD
jgi:hypothetical protein